MKCFRFEMIWNSDRTVGLIFASSAEDAMARIRAKFKDSQIQWVEEI